MTTEIRHTCNRCRRPILESRSAFRTESGPERIRLETWDLCHSCLAGLVLWLSTPPAPTEAAPEQAELALVDV
jgi:hypothetical protein